MTVPAVRIRGLRQMTQVLDALPPDLVRNAFASALRRGLLPVQNEIQSRAPMRASGGVKFIGSGGEKTKARRKAVVYTDEIRRPGYLRASVARKRGKATAQSMTVGITFRKAWYWFLQEFGSSRQAARPFVRPAVAVSSQHAFSEFARAIRPAIARQVRRLAQKHGSLRIKGGR